MGAKLPVFSGRGVVRAFAAAGWEIARQRGIAIRFRRRYSPAMSTPTFTPVDPKKLRPLLHAEVDKLRDENLLVLHRVALELELDEVTERLNAGFDADRAAGKLARLPEMIREARAAVRARQAQ